MKAGNTVEQLEILKALRNCSRIELKQNLADIKKLQNRVDYYLDSIDSLNVFIDETLANVLKK